MTMSFYVENILIYFTELLVNVIIKYIRNFILFYYIINMDFEQKYLKYKSKYLALKNQIGNGVDSGDQLTVEQTVMKSNSMFTANSANIIIKNINFATRLSDLIAFLSKSLDKQGMSFDEYKASWKSIDKKYIPGIPLHPNYGCKANKTYVKFFTVLELTYKNAKTATKVFPLIKQLVLDYYKTPDHQKDIVQYNKRAEENKDVRTELTKDGYYSERYIKNVITPQIYSVSKGRISYEDVISKELYDKSGPVNDYLYKD